MSLDEEIDRVLNRQKVDGVYYQNLERFISEDLKAWLIKEASQRDGNDFITILRMKKTTEGVVLISYDNAQRHESNGILFQMGPLVNYLNEKYDTDRFSYEKVSNIRWRIIYKYI